jgi:hypothetical protein
MADMLTTCIMNALNKYLYRLSEKKITSCGHKSNTLLLLPLQLLLLLLLLVLLLLLSLHQGTETQLDVSENGHEIKTAVKLIYWLHETKQLNQLVCNRFSQIYRV